MVWLIAIVAVGCSAAAVLAVIHTPLPGAHRVQFTLRTLLLVVVGAAILFALPGWFAALIRSAFGSVEVVQQITFESEAWKRADPIERHRSVRSQMIDDLLVRYDLRQWPRSKVTEL